MKIGLLCLLILGLVGCSWERKEHDIDGSIRAQLPFAINGKYGLYVLDLTTLFNLENLRGSAAQFLMDPSASNGRLNGVAPTVRYIRNSEGVIVPKDSLSLQLLTVYAHIERLQDLDKNSGAGGILRYPRTVAVNAQYRGENGNLENNALYSGEFDALLMVPYTDQSLPIMANGGIIAHEHFHALFYHLVIAKLGKLYPDFNPSPKQEPPGRAGLTHMEGRLENRGQGNNKVETKQELRRRYHSMVMRGLNEGLADVWGWVYSGDTNFVGRSLPQEKVFRNLDTPAEILDSQLVLQTWVERSAPNTDLMATAYSLGSQVARAIKGFNSFYTGKDVKLSPENIRQDLGKILIKTLPELRKKIESLKEDEYLNPSSILQLYAAQVPNLTKEGCEYFQNLIPLQEQGEDLNIAQKCADIP